MAGKGPLEKLKDEVGLRIISALGELSDEREIVSIGSLDDIGISVSIPPAGHGDFAYPMFPLARIFKKSPTAIASDVKTILDSDQEFSSRFISRAEGPYINIEIKPDVLTSTVMTAIVSEDTSFGAHADKQRIILEHTSANPNGPLHVGRARNPIIGDTMARLLRARGYDVEVQYYVDDMGRQVMTLYWGVKHLKDNELPPMERDKKDYHYVRYYQKANEIIKEDKSLDSEILSYIREMEKGGPVAEEVHRISSEVLDGMEMSLSRMGITIDRRVWESSFVKNGDVTALLDRLRQTEYMVTDGSAEYLELESFGISGRSTRLYLTRSDGSTLYTTRDIAYHLWKLNNASRVIDILGEDHKNQSRMLTAALRILGEKNMPEVMFYSFVSLPEGRMSTRKGLVVYLDDLLDEAVERAMVEVRKKRPDLSEDDMRTISEAVGTAAVRFNIIKVYHEKNMTFRWEDALDFEGDSAPFIMYTYARASSILNNLDSPERPSVEYARHLVHPSELTLIRKMGDFPEVLEDSAENMRPNTMANYAIELASAFNQFYRDCPVLKAEGSKKKGRILLVHAFRTVMKRTMYCLGLAPLESM